MKSQGQAEEWLNYISENPHRMSQRKLDSVEKWEGGVDNLTRRAKEKGVHLLLLVDDKGDQLIAGSTKPFQILT